ncbi:uncharacterized protein RDI95_011718 isoform 3-T6 [Morus bassanus]
MGDEEEPPAFVLHEPRDHPQKEQDADSGGASTPPDSPVSSRTRKKSAPAALRAPLREAVGPDGGTMLIKFIVKQHNPDWNDTQLLLEYMTETEKQLILKTARDLAEDYRKITGGDDKEYLPLQDPKWDANRSVHMERLQAYQGWILKGMEKAIPKTINWSTLYAIKQGPSESPSKFLD